MKRRQFVASINIWKLTLKRTTSVEIFFSPTARSRTITLLRLRSN
jgi:hypothetical protein